MTWKFVQYKQSGIRYCRSGSGPRPVICLHGFNEDASSFTVLENKNNRYSILAIDAPFHGATQWKQGLYFSPAELHEIIHTILKTETLGSDQAPVLVGFSLGGRMALSYYGQYPDEIKQLILFAPDGLKFNCWYSFAARSFIGNRIFNFTMQHPGWFISTAGILCKLGIINAGVKKFVAHYLHDAPVRNILYKTWTAFRFFDPRIREIKKNIEQHKTPVQLYFGKFDTVVPPASGRTFIKGIEAYTQMHIVDTGHRLLQTREAQDALNDAVEK